MLSPRPGPKQIKRCTRIFLRFFLIRHCAPNESIPPLFPYPGRLERTKQRRPRRGLDDWSISRRGDAAGFPSAQSRSRCCFFVTASAIKSVHVPARCSISFGVITNVEYLSCLRRTGLVVNDGLGGGSGVLHQGASGYCQSGRQLERLLYRRDGRLRLVRSSSRDRAWRKRIGRIQVMSAAVSAAARSGTTGK